MVNMIIGASDRYTWDQLKYWCNSIKKTGFAGRKVLVFMNVDKGTVDKVISEGFEVVHTGTFHPSKQVWEYTPRLTVHAERFVHIWNFLRDQADVDLVCTTDTKDVVFQDYPFLYDVAAHLCTVAAGSECLKYKDEPWGAQNLKETFGDFFYEQFKESPILNVGVLMGRYDMIRDLCLMIYQMSNRKPTPICDQSTFNFLSWLNPWKRQIAQVPLSAGWVVHCGTTMDPTKIEGFRPNLLENVDKITLVNDKVSYVIDNMLQEYPFHIVHQWDRVPEFTEMVRRVYGD